MQRKCCQNYCKAASCSTQGGFLPPLLWNCSSPLLLGVEPAQCKPSSDPHQQHALDGYPSSGAWQ